MREFHVAVRSDGTAVWLSSDGWGDLIGGVDAYEDAYLMSIKDVNSVEVFGYECPQRYGFLIETRNLFDPQVPFARLDRGAWFRAGLGMHADALVRVWTGVESRRTEGNSSFFSADTTVLRLTQGIFAGVLDPSRRADDLWAGYRVASEQKGLVEPFIFAYRSFLRSFKRD